MLLLRGRVCWEGNEEVVPFLAPTGHPSPFPTSSGEKESGSFSRLGFLS